MKFFYSVVAFVLAAVASGCSGDSRPYVRPPVKVGVMTVGSDAADGGNEYVGVVEEKTGIVLSFEIPGQVSVLKADAGDKVAKGQLLARVTPTTLKDAHYTAVVTLNQARDAYKRMKPLHEGGVVSDIKWVEVETRLKQAEAAERIAREQLGHTGLYAPISGVISSRTAEVGQNVMTGQQVYKLVDVSEIDVKISVPENDISSLKVGQTAEISIKAAGGETLRGTLTEKGVEADPVSHTYPVKIALANTGGRLLPGMVCSVRLSAAADATSGRIAVPLGAVELNEDNARFVWIAKDGKAERRAVTLGKFVGDDVEVLSGLAAGDRLIVEGARKVSEGMKVTEDKKNGRQ